jgi:hypothetical protein
MVEVPPSAVTRQPEFPASLWDQFRSWMFPFAINIFFFSNVPPATIAGQRFPRPRPPPHTQMAGKCLFRVILVTENGRKRAFTWNTYEKWPILQKSSKKVTPEADFLLSKPPEVQSPRSA